MENEIEAQGMLIKDNPFSKVGLGNDNTINWIASDGDPTVVSDATISPEATFIDTDVGVRLTPASNIKAGYLYWQKIYDLNNSMIINTLVRAGSGNGADGITISYGGTGIASQSNSVGGIAIYLDEYNGDVVKIYKAGVKIGEFHTYETLDNNQYYAWTIVHEHVGADYYMF